MRRFSFATDRASATSRFLDPDRVKALRVRALLVAGLAVHGAVLSSVVTGMALTFGAPSTRAMFFAILAGFAISALALLVSGVTILLNRSALPALAASWAGMIAACLLGVLVGEHWRNSDNPPDDEMALGLIIATACAGVILVIPAPIVALRSGFRLACEQEITSDCAACGYSLIGLPTPQCPECGAFSHPLPPVGEGRREATG